MSKCGSCFKCVAATLAGAGLTAAAFIYSGWYPMAADEPHHPLTYRLLETLRERSIMRASAAIEVPADLDSARRLLAGGADYNDMCTGCHFKPGQTASDLSLGLYPAPPNLTQMAETNDDATTQVRRRFWIIKHGIKASGMPAWGAGHDDERIWNMVAFLARLPQLSLPQYQILTARGSSDDGDH